MNAIDFSSCISNQTRTMFPSSAGKLISKAKKSARTTLPHMLAPTTASRAFTSAIVRCRSLATMNNNPVVDPTEIEELFKQKRSLRSIIRKELKNMDPIQRLQEDNAIQEIVLGSSWFKESKSVCGYISCPALREVDTSRIVSEILSNNEKDRDTRKKLYVPRVEDMNSNMKMLRISRVDDLILNSMNILEPGLVDSEGNKREDVMQASDPVDLFILPGLAFDESGRRLGRSGGYYDLFLKNYQERAKEQKWKQPFFVALAYSLQILKEGAVPVTPYDIQVDGIVTPSGFCSCKRH